MPKKAKKEIHSMMTCHHQTLTCDCAAQRRRTANRVVRKGDRARLIFKSDQRTDRRTLIY
nr:hypothetical protein [Aphanothece hegewaldii]